MNRFNLDAAVSALLDWDFEVFWKGTARKTLPPSLGTLFALEKLAKEKGSDSETKTATLLATLFQGGESAIADMPLHAVKLAVDQLFEYFKEYSEKNAQASIREAATKAGRQVSGQS